MSKQTEALKLALEALEETRNALAWFYDSYPQDVTKKGNELLPHVETVLTAIREALAEQTALLAANKDLQNHFDALMNDYKKLSALCSSQGTRLMEYESSHEPESKPWVGLTRDERMSIINRFAGQDWVYAVEAIEAKLKDKNGY